MGQVYEGQRPGEDRTIIYPAVPRPIALGRLLGSNHGGNNLKKHRALTSEHAKVVDNDKMESNNMSMSSTNGCVKGRNLSMGGPTFFIRGFR
jgi:hypothetical protein